MARTIIELAEYQTKSPQLEEEFLYEETKQEEDKTLEKLQLTQEDKKLRNFLKKQGILTIRELRNGLEISSSSHIGVVQFSNFTVKVLPKFSLNIKNLPKLIAYAFDLDDIIIPESEITFQAEEKQLIDILITFFVRKCQQLLRQGLVKSYVTYQDDVKFLRGKLMLKQQIRHVIRKKPEFACEFDELEYNNLENQILLFCLKRSYHFTESDSLRKEIRRLIHQFSGLIDDIQITFDDFDKINYNRLNQHYKKIHDLCKLIISATGIGDFYQERQHIVSSFFVDMNKIFEKFVTRLFREFYPESHTVESQKGKRAWQTDSGGGSYIRTDILLTNETGQTKIIDTKYKRKLSREDPYQIGFYIHEYKQREGFAILPKYSDSTTQSMTSQVQEITIYVRTIDIDETIDLLYSHDEQSRNQLKTIVQTLVPP